MLQHGGTLLTVWCADYACQCCRIQLSISARSEDCRTRLEGVQQEICCCLWWSPQYRY